MNARPRKSPPFVPAGLDPKQGIGGPLRDEVYHDIRAEFISAMHAEGIGITEPGNIVPDGEIHRFHIDGHKSGSLNGWAVLHLDAGVAAGAFGNWQTGQSTKWRAGRGRVSPAEVIRIDEIIKAAQSRREAKRAESAAHARILAGNTWDNATEASADHPYLKRKGIQPHGIRQSGNLLIIPLWNIAGELESLQYITPEGKKRFLSGGRVRGLFCTIGTLIPDPRIVICEGFATAASLHEATGLLTVAAMNCGNLLPVARNWKHRYNGHAYIIGADNDADTEGNPGLTAARAAAEATGAKLIVPEPPFNDFNDQAHAERKEAV